MNTKRSGVSKAIRAAKRTNGVKEMERVSKAELRNKKQYRDDEKARNTKARSTKRKDQEYRDAEQGRDTMARKTRREDPDNRDAEQAQDTTAHRTRREDPEYRDDEQGRDSMARKTRREDLAYRDAEQAQNTMAHKTRREDLAYRDAEQAQNTMAHKTRREDLAYRDAEQAQNTMAHKTRREDPAYRDAEQAINTTSHKARRENPDYRDAERERDCLLHTISRQDPLLLEKQRDKNRQDHQEKRTANRASYEVLLKNYQTCVLERPECACGSCGGMWYRSSVSEITFEKVVSVVGIDIATKIPTNGLYYFCQTCNKTIKANEIPRICLANGLMFPDIAEPLQGLSQLEERLVAGRIPFMQIRSLGADQQYGIRGGVVNVPNDLDVVAKVLPRSFNEASVVQVKFSRRMKYQGSYLFQTVRPLKVYLAANYLIQTELYSNENIILSESWRNKSSEDTLQFVVEEEDAKSLSSDYDGEDIDAQDVTYEDQSDSDGKNMDDNDVTTERSNEDESDEDEQSTEIPLTETLLSEDLDCVQIAPGENQTPRSLLYDLHAEQLSFPSIYGGVRRVLLESRISHADISRSEARRFDRRCAQPMKLFYSHRLVQTYRLAANIQLCLRKKRRSGAVTAGQLLSSESVANLVQQDDGYRLLRNITNSPAYLEDRKRDLMAMIRQLGLPSLFITLSSAETKWPELLRSLHKLKSGIELTDQQVLDLTFRKKSDLIRSDPIVCAMSYDHRERALFRTLLKPAAGVFSPYEISDNFWKREVQQRGSLHGHMLAFMQEAPKYNSADPDSHETCIKFIDNYITCARDDSEEMKNLIGLQLHKHSQTCKKGNQTQCRFNIPVPPMRFTNILAPLPNDTDPAIVKKLKAGFERIHTLLSVRGRKFDEEESFDELLAVVRMTEEEYILCVRSNLKRQKVYLKRKSNEAFINQYNKDVLLAWGANMDIQFVLDGYSCASYVVNYVSKCDKGVSNLLRAVEKELQQGNTTVKERLRKFANVFARSSEVSSQEAACNLLRIPMTMCSRDTVYINTGPPDQRVILVRDQSELEDLDADSEDIAMKGMLDRYVVRPDILDDTCLADFAAEYNYVKTKGSRRKQPEVVPENATVLTDESGYLLKRQRPRIIRYRRYGKAEDPSNYYREQLMLYFPWRHETEDLLNINSEVIFGINATTIAMNRQKYDPNLNEAELQNMVDQAHEYEDNPPLVLASEFEFTNDSGYEQDIGRDMGLPTKSFESIRAPKQIPDEDYRNLMKTLNSGQRRYLLHVLRNIKHRTHQMFDLVHGQAGVGKSRLIEALVQVILRYCGKEVGNSLEQFPVIVAAPTGKAAFNVLGMTLHGTFRLPPNQYGGDLVQLDHGSCNSLRTKYLNLRLLILDEVSMISLKQLQQIDVRLRQIFGSQEPMGSCSVIAFGDFFQLRPVFGQFVFEIGRAPLCHLIGNALWQPFQMFELTEIMRQKDDKVFALALRRLAIGELTEEDIKLFESREVSPDLNPDDDVIRLFRSNLECERYNSEYISKLGNKAIESPAIDQIQGRGSEADKTRMLNYAKSFTTADADGMPTSVTLCVGSRYMISTNIDVPDGLFNGATGVLQEIRVGQLNSGESAVRMVSIMFENPFIGLSARRSQIQEGFTNHDWTPLRMLTKVLQKKGQHEGMQIVRKQIPLTAANGVTIHKSQGSSLKQVVVSVPSKGLTRVELYVACSRATSLGGLFIQGSFEAPTKMPENHLVKVELNRLKKQGFKWNLPYLPEIDQTLWNSLVFHNVQSFGNHRLDILPDPVYTCSDFIALAETWSLKEDVIDIPSFTVVHRNDSVVTRSSLGSAVFAKHEAGQATFELIKDKDGHHLQMTSWNSDNIVLVMLYRHPKCSIKTLLRELRSVLEKLKIKKAIIVGDFNIDFLDVKSSYLLKLFEEFAFKICLPSRPTSDGSTMIDACFSNFSRVFAWTYESYFSYHKPICVIWPKRESEELEMPSILSDVLHDVRNTEVILKDLETSNIEQVDETSEPMEIDEVNAVRFGIPNVGNSMFPK